MLPRFYEFKRPDLPWGDYSDILVHGMAQRSADGTSLELDRCGPFVPPISLPYGHVIVTAPLLVELQNTEFKGFSVHSVTKRRIPKIDWRRWEPYGPEEMKYPAGGEPENYLLRRKHSAEAADALGELFELRFGRGIKATREGGYRLLAESWNGADFIASDGLEFSHNYVSERARDWLLEHGDGWIGFREERVA